jgi:hypothetical protein
MSGRLLAVCKDCRDWFLILCSLMRWSSTLLFDAAASPGVWITPTRGNDVITGPSEASHSESVSQARSASHDGSVK